MRKIKYSLFFAIITNLAFIVLDYTLCHENIPYWAAFLLDIGLFFFYYFILAEIDKK